MLRWNVFSFRKNGTTKRFHEPQEYYAFVVVRRIDSHFSFKIHSEINLYSQFCRFQSQLPNENWQSENTHEFKCTLKLNKYLLINLNYFTELWIRNIQFAGVWCKMRNRNFTVSIRILLTQQVRHYVNLDK